MILSILLGLVIPFGAVILGIIILCAALFLIKLVPDTIILPKWKQFLQWGAVLIFILWLCVLFGLFHMAITV